MGIRRTVISATAMTILAVSAGRAQNEFEAASVKTAKAGVRGYSIQPLPGRLHVVNTNLKMLVAAAYHVYDFQVSGGPKWVDSDRYDIEAKAAGEKPPGEYELMNMLQTLLAKRFSLEVRKETKDLPVYALEIGKGGSKLVQPKDAEGDPYFRVFQRRQITARRAPLSYLTEALSQLMGRPVIDKTGLAGVFDFKLEWSPDEMQVRSDENPATDSSLPNFSSALQEQLGLRIQSQKGPVEIVVIERAEKPSEN